MSHTLTFGSVYKSITSLPAIELPCFVVLTGVNGSGKTHLLTAIRDSKVHTSITHNPAADVRLFDSTNIIPSDTGVFDPSQYHSQRSQWFTILSKSRENHFSSLQQNVINLGVPASYCSSAKAIESLTIEKLKRILPNPENAVDVYTNIKESIKQISLQISQNAYQQIGDEHWRKVIPKIQSTNPGLFLSASQSDLYSDENFIWGEVDPFQQAFGRVFTTYRDLIHENDRLEKYPITGDSTRKHLTPKQFTKKFGIPPWDFVNQILEECQLDFRVDHPPLHEITSYEPKLNKISSDVEMRFQDLSSGEKVLMSFALCLYNTQDNRQSKVFPKLLLLDEVDAPLHPSMTLSLLNTIQNVLVKDKKVAVILTTHSPSTVALAPEDSIYVMDPTGPSIKKQSKSSALSLLTAGVPTLSVSFDGRRQIFVESRSDAGLYDCLYQKYKSLLQSERSLVFIEVGNKNESNKLEQNAGCEQVIRLVNVLNEGGNKSVLGLIDWDGKRFTQERIHVLSQGFRDGLESLLFDPVLIVATLIHYNRSFMVENKIISDQEKYVLIGDWDQKRWQSAIDAMQVLIVPTLNLNDSLEIEYLNEMKLQVSRGYLHMDDHDLENRIIECFPFLRPRNKHAGDLMRHITNTVLTDYPQLLPKELLTAFKLLLEDNIK
jgi:energy-coupling factor transporter ATP-binding protein EcfA2